MPNRATLPIDGNRSHVPLTPATVALATTVDDTISSATSITLNASTTFLEVTAITAGIYMRYQAGAASNAFDEYILANSTRHFYVPNGVTVVSFIQDASVGTALLRVVEK